MRPYFGHYNCNNCWHEHSRQTSWEGGGEGHLQKNVYVWFELEPLHKITKKTAHVILKLWSLQSKKKIIGTFSKMMGFFSNFPFNPKLYPLCVTSSKLFNLEWIRQEIANRKCAKKIPHRRSITSHVFLKKVELIKVFTLQMELTCISSSLL